MLGLFLSVDLDLVGRSSLTDSHVSVSRSLVTVLQGGGVGVKIRSHSPVSMRSDQPDKEPVLQLQLHQRGAGLWLDCNYPNYGAITAVSANY